MPANRTPTGSPALSPPAELSLGLGQVAFLIRATIVIALLTLAYISTAHI